MPDFDSKHFLQHCARKPGVYRMLDAEEQVLYVGKARNLQARLSSYFQKNVSSVKTRAMVARIADVQTTVTRSEAEALLLEQSLIKSIRPPYNILLRDDKSYPYIRITSADTYPRITFHRGTRRKGSDYFGPYPSGGAVREALSLVEKVFQVRNCSDSYFRNRTRPCLQHQINRCTAPCVGLVSPEDYAGQVRMARDFLDGRSREVVDTLSAQMEAAAAGLAFEKAALLRDKLAAIQAVQQKQVAETGQGDLDVVAIEGRHGLAVLDVLMIRGGRILGHRNFRPDTRGEEALPEILEAFLSQYYLGDREDPVKPQEILLTLPVEGAPVLQEALTEQWGRKVRLAWKVRGERAAWLQMATTNAQQSLATELAAREHMESRFLALESLLEAQEPVRRIECFDISHTQGEKAVASCVVFDQQGARKTDYRHFNVSPDQAGDDYAAIEEAVRRRYQRRLKEEGRLPDLLLIDGGKGQMQRAWDVMGELGLQGRIRVMGIGKGPSRRPGFEVLYLPDGREFTPGPSHSALHLLQQVRDEAHRFALTGHRARRGKARKQSSLDEIPGIGPKRRKALLTHFGGLKQLRNASATELARVPGVNTQLAQQIYDWLHE
ncbi:excinuclease ABC subunit C [Alcanivorax sp. P2S70]|uniref:UvrABC system protein C n=1 Tax=Alcanivorax profundi TaxID=2338368 RepID=A0A418Y378_9GAMM|nr:MULTISPECIES: excinuclease ABC subunit UvrC [Alcanivorax]ERP92790.1 excinuclease ABC subunit C [Alcanivorax sp. P2S70]RJG19963.1 excinuclease ABC subunit UvrC [Alcanivorax profundi]